MRQSYLLVCSALLLSCAPGERLQPFNPGKGAKSNASAQPIGSDAIPVPDEEAEGPRLPPPDDPLEEEKAIEPAIIGGAYLYCDSTEGKGPAAEPEPMTVGCRIGNVPDKDWLSGEKSAFVMNTKENSITPSTVSITPEGSPYHMLFNADRSLQNIIELQVEVMLPQGRLQMSTTVNPGSIKAIEQRLGKGLALFASTGSAGDWPGVDRKTWNLWMPVEIPRFITNFNPASNSGPQGDEKKTPAKVELTYDETVCTYQVREGDIKGNEIKGAKPEDFVFVSCTRNWQPGQWVRVKSLGLNLTSGGVRGTTAAGVVLRTE